ncbi:hypothetical protein Runsl_5102 [Runella slithyformis DSM 19594]|uniref:Uncharacterized protein n=1 Tax=Runella slithyformis (strain ATCC 29530 / DSM 19594 / LMG 11500 / NCIMB 11436 / LSU 4) TaxID=761193 RepID=A0A7U4E8M7_RUNSL|nr:hypothetical protein Runsl_5102 [Runella slithyformis DSM 19594]
MANGQGLNYLLGLTPISIVAKDLERTSTFFSKVLHFKERRPSARRDKNGTIRK